MGAKPRPNVGYVGAAVAVAQPASLGESGIEAVYREMRARATGSANVGAFTRRRVAVSLHRDGELLVALAPADAPAYLTGYDDLCAAPLGANLDPKDVAARLVDRLDVGGVSLAEHGVLESHPPGGPRLLTHVFRAACTGPAPAGTAWRDRAAIIAAHAAGTRLLTPALLAECGVSAPGGARSWPLAAGACVVALQTPTLPPATRTNCYLFGAGELVIIDPATPHPSEQIALDGVIDSMIAGGARPVAVWLTHHHNDHVADAGRVASRYGIPIAAHPETARLLAGRLEVREHLGDGDRLELAGEPRRTLRAVFTPGHAAGHHCYVEEATGLCVAGDMVAGVGTILIDPSEGDMTEYLASLRRLVALAPQRLLPAHGPVLTEPIEALDRYTMHRLWREQRVVAALEAAGGDARVEALVPGAYADVAQALHGLAARSLLSHLVKLQRDGRAHEEKGRWRLSP